MEKNYVRDILEDIENLAQHQDINSIIAICKNELEEIDKLNIKQQLADILKTIEDVKYEVIRLRCSNSEDLYKMLDEVDLNLKNLIINIKELIHDSRNQD